MYISSQITPLINIQIDNIITLNMQNVKSSLHHFTVHISYQI